MIQRPGALLAGQRGLLPASRLTLGLLLKPRAGALPHRFARSLRLSSMRTLQPGTRAKKTTNLPEKQGGEYPLPILREGEARRG